MKAAAWYHRRSSSGFGMPKNPPTSAPANGRPATPSARTIRGARRSCAQLAVLSPVHTAPWRWEPMKKARDNRKGRSAFGE
eukprot:scaffold115206_cov31-Tisochrysis_lutea.AAC.3